MRTPPAPPPSEGSDRPDPAAAPASGDTAAGNTAAIASAASVAATGPAPHPDTTSARGPDPAATPGPAPAAASAPGSAPAVASTPGLGPASAAAASAAPAPTPGRGPGPAAAPTTAAHPSPAATPAAPPGSPSAVPAALAEPTSPVGALWVAGISLANLGMWMAFFGPLQVLLPEQVGVIAPESKETTLAWVTGVGALMATLGTPLAGALSDRTTGPLGRRRPWVLLGAVLGGIGLIVLGRQDTPQ